MALFLETSHVECHGFEFEAMNKLELQIQNEKSLAAMMVLWWKHEPLSLQRVPDGTHEIREHDDRIATLLGSTVWQGVPGTRRMRVQDTQAS